MNLLCYSLSHVNCPLELREAFAFSEHQRSRLQQSLLKKNNAQETLILCTCNRTEFYIVVPRGKSFDFFESFASDILVDTKIIEQHLHCYRDAEALTHLFALSCGLRSQVIGETEILAQIKSAYINSISAGTCGRILNQVFQKAFSVSKKVRSSTEIGCYRVSVASVAVKQALDYCDGDFNSKQIAVWGTGQVGRAVVKSLVKSGLKRGTIISRDSKKSGDICPNWLHVHTNNYSEVLKSADIFFCCTGAPHSVITDDDLDGTSFPQLLFDLAMPRDVSITPDKHENVTLIDLENLEVEASGNHSARENAASAIFPEIQQQAEAFWKCLTAQKHSECIADWRMQAHELLEHEMVNLRREFPDMTPQQLEQLELMSKRLMHRMLHIPSVAMKKAIASDLPCADFLLEAFSDE